MAKNKAPLAGQTLQNNKKQDLYGKTEHLINEFLRQKEEQLTEEKAIERAKLYVKWAKDDKTALSRNRFSELISVDRQTFDNQCRYFPVLAYADQIVRGIIADRMYEGAAHINPEQKLTSDALKNFRRYSTDAQEIKEMEIQDEVKKIKAKASAEAQASGKRYPEGNYNEGQYKSELDELGEQSNPQQDNPTPLSKDINK